MDYRFVVSQSISILFYALFLIDVNAAIQ